MEHYLWNYINNLYINLDLFNIIFLTKKFEFIEYVHFFKYKYNIDLTNTNGKQTHI